MKWKLSDPGTINLVLTANIQKRFLNDTASCIAYLLARREKSESGFANIVELVCRGIIAIQCVKNAISNNISHTAL